MRLKGALVLPIIVLYGLWVAIAIVTLVVATSIFRHDG